jgi:hypothetical protein
MSENVGLEQACRIGASFVGLEQVSVASTQHIAGQSAGLRRMFPPVETKKAANMAAFFVRRGRGPWEN